MGRSERAFLWVVLAQACHSTEEYSFRLWEVLAPARWVAEALTLQPAAGFAVANAALVLFGLWCWLWPVRRGWKRARAFMWGWAVLEAANGVGHTALAVAAGGYFPGVYTAPLLLAASAWLILSLRREAGPAA